jgi:hypothetical protein
MAHKVPLDLKVRKEIRDPRVHKASKVPKGHKALLGQQELMERF